MSVLDPHSGSFVASFCDRLIAAGLIDELSAHRALKAQARTGERVDLVLSRLGLVNESDIARMLAAELGLDTIGALDFPDQPVLANLVPARFVRARRLLPVRQHDGTLVAACADPFDADAAAALSYLVECPVSLRVAPRGELEQAIARIYQDDTPAGDAGAIRGDDETVDQDIQRLQDQASEAPVIRFVQDMIERAVAANASDIHVEPGADGVRVRLRIDGILHTDMTLASERRAAIVSRIKLLAKLNIAERRVPQDGRILSVVQGRDVDLRVSTMPTLHGERAVLRILDRASVALDFDRLGYSGPLLARLRQVIDRPNGIVLVTGPTGSGKTTTLYAALNSLNRSERHICTIEDPIEFRLDGINQVQVQPGVGLTFASALRSMLRQDPDIIMVGEIRDLETAQIAMRASLTGHLVLSTLHTNGAAAAVARLLDMGVENYQVASSLTAVLAQRLVRRLCRECAAPTTPEEAGIDRLTALLGDAAPTAPRDAQLRKPVGCRACRNTGFAGRTTVVELLELDPPMRELILAHGSQSRIEQAAVAQGMVPMAAHGLQRVLAGETTVDEVMGVVR